MRIGEINQVVAQLKAMWKVEPDGPHLVRGHDQAGRPIKWKRCLGSQERGIIESWIGQAVVLGPRSKMIVTELIKHHVLERDRSIERQLGGAWFKLDVEALEKWQLETALKSEGAE